MAITVPRPRMNDERGLAHSLERRSPQAGVSSSSVSTFVPESTTSATRSATSGVSPSTVISLAVFLGIIGTILLVIVLWKLWAWWSWRRKNRQTASDMVDSEKQCYLRQSVNVSFASTDESASTLHCPEPTALAPVVTRDSRVGWTPQIRSVVNYGPRPQPGEKSSFVRSKSKWNKVLLGCDELPPMTQQISPPPAYKTPPDTPPKANSTRSAAERRPEPLRASSDAAATENQCLQPPTPATALKSAPLPSPRSASFAPHQTKRVSRSASDDHRLPRLMTVIATFDPSLNDELVVSAGEVLRLIEEYEDEWCLVQRVGGANPEKGVIPRFCLAERVAVVPSVSVHGSMKLSNGGSTNSRQTA